MGKVVSQIKVIMLPYKNFKDKIKKVKQFESKYHIEDISQMESVRGFLYMERRTKEVRNSGA
ncbi:hypothetical protein [Clostridium guangxiense]|uniref:hypothetical protein n=1 Tax=Clostridium guangxiense TaxID=1662055 RepID=UPI001E65E029|nr:hypothetical protein [Clostridium guangxiense]MCD2345789.1 hypothetical protein [Clostridium guangxiense]